VNGMLFVHQLLRQTNPWYVTDNLRVAFSDLPV
jgi:hypothetical protein